MKGLMFNNKYGLEDDVLNGTKTMTRRKLNIPRTFNGIFVAGFRKYTNSLGEWFTELYDEDESSIYGSTLKPPYDISETVAIKQPYNKIYPITDFEMVGEQIINGSAGWTNKMFVRNDLMPHGVKVLNIFPQRIQDISNEDCLKEGIIKHISHNKVFYSFHGIGNYFFDTPREAYSCLIDKISGNGTWINNNWVWALEFELER